MTSSKTDLHIALAQLNPHLGDVDANCDKLLHMRARATEQGCQILLMTGAGKIGLANQPRGTFSVIGRVKPEFCGIYPKMSESSNTDRTVNHIEISTVPMRGIFIGRSDTCGAVPSRSTSISSPEIVIVTTSGKSRRSGSSRKPSIKVFAE